MGRCWGITRKRKRCKNNAVRRWFCDKHAVQPICFLVLVLAPIFYSYIAGHIPKLWENKVVPDPLSQYDLTEIDPFNHTLFIHKSDNHLRANNRSRFGGFQFNARLSMFISNQLKENENLIKAKLNEDIKKIVEFYHNMILIKLIDHFFWMHSARWDTNVFSLRQRNSELKESYVDSEKSPPFDFLTWEHLLNTKQQNNFYDLLLAFSNFTIFKETTVPPKTKASFIITGHRKEMVLNNSFVEVTIAITQRGVSSELGDHKWLDDKSEEFWSARFRVNCNAKFEKSKSEDPMMPKYKQWVEAMFAEVQDLLDEEE